MINTNYLNNKISILATFTHFLFFNGKKEIIWKNTFLSSSFF